MIVVGKLLCVIYDNSWGGQVDNRNRSKPSQAQELCKAREWGGGGGIALPCGREGTLSHERDREGPICVVLQRLDAQVCMFVIQLIPGVACKTCSRHGFLHQRMNTNGCDTK
jgi:hypothetical protein